MFEIPTRTHAHTSLRHKRIVLSTLIDQNAGFRKKGRDGLPLLPFLFLLSASGAMGQELVLEEQKHDLIVHFAELIRRETRNTRPCYSQKNGERLI